MASKKRSGINYTKLATMWEQGKSYEEMGKALGMKGHEKNDLWKPVRAAISNMLRGKATAWKDGNGKVKTLKPREGMRAIGVGKKAPKPKPVKKATPKKAAVKKAVAPQVDGKTAAAGGSRE
jgi:hypothetical protein